VPIATVAESGSGVKDSGNGVRQVWQADAGAGVSVPQY
jgi:hypothetical protein